MRARRRSPRRGPARPQSLGELSRLRLARRSAASACWRRCSRASGRRRPVDRLLDDKARPGRRDRFGSGLARGKRNRLRRFDQRGWRGEFGGGEFAGRRARAALRPAEAALRPEEAARRRRLDRLDFVERLLLLGGVALRDQRHVDRVGRRGGQDRRGDEGGRRRVQGQGEDDRRRPQPDRPHRPFRLRFGRGPAASTRSRPLDSRLGLRRLAPLSFPRVPRRGDDGDMGDAVARQPVHDRDDVAVGGVLVAAQAHDARAIRSPILASTASTSASS